MLRNRFRLEDTAATFSCFSSGDGVDDDDDTRTLLLAKFNDRLLILDDDDDNEEGNTWKPLT